MPAIKTDGARSIYYGSAIGRLRDPAPRIAPDFVGQPGLLLDVMVHDMMLDRVLRNEFTSAVGHKRVGTCRIRIILMILTTVVGHDGATEAEKDCNGDYTESFIEEVSRLIGRYPLSWIVAREPKLGAPPAGAIRLPFRQLNSILMGAADRTSG